jgi:hypothetical protein
MDGISMISGLSNGTRLPTHSFSSTKQRCCSQRPSRFAMAGSSSQADIARKAWSILVIIAPIKAANFARLLRTTISRSRSANCHLTVLLVPSSQQGVLPRFGIVTCRRPSDVTPVCSILRGGGPSYLPSMTMDQKMTWTHALPAMASTGMTVAATTSSLLSRPMRNGVMLPGDGILDG